MNMLKEQLPPYRYDLTGFCSPDRNRLTIEVATTLERERSGGEKRSILRHHRFGVSVYRVIHSLHTKNQLLPTAQPHKMC